MALRDKFPWYEQAHVSLTSLRAPMRGELLPIAVDTSSSRYVVPAPWRGSFVRLQADGGDVYLQVSTADDAVCDPAARAGEAGEPIDLTPAADGCFRIPDGTWLDVPVPVDAQSFALVGSAPCVARTHPSES